MSGTPFGDLVPTSGSSHIVGGRRVGEYERQVGGEVSNLIGSWLDIVKLIFGHFLFSTSPGIMAHEQVCA